jgi:hypothetical protein
MVLLNPAEQAGKQASKPAIQFQPGIENNRISFVS